jgi:uncharacterized protein
VAEWYSCIGDDVLLVLHVQPGAKRSEVSGLHGDALKIRLSAPPIEGRANAALLRFIADLFGVPLRNVELQKGAQSRHKMIRVSGSEVEPETLLKGK